MYGGYTTACIYKFFLHTFEDLECMMCMLFRLFVDNAFYSAYCEAVFSASYCVTLL